MSEVELDQNYFISTVQWNLNKTWGLNYARYRNNKVSLYHGSLISELFGYYWRNEYHSLYLLRTSIRYVPCRGEFTKERNFDNFAGATVLLYKNSTRQEGLFPMEKSDPILITTSVKKTIFQLFSCVQAGCTNYFIVLYRCVDIFPVSVMTWPSETASWTSCGRKRASLMTCLVRCVVLSLKNLISKTKCNDL